jgi:S1-C subfamily serine protease
MWRTEFFSILLFLLSPGLTGVQQKTVPPPPSGQQWVNVVDKVHSAIVTIETQSALGTGFLVQRNGTFVTNYHVIEDAQQITVTLESGEVYRAAYLLRTDEEKDIAILRIEAADLPFVDLGNSDSTKVGEEVMAIGTPEGLEQTVSTGILSGKRLMPSGYVLLQTTAPVSHGSSGGPLLNRDAKTIGIITSFLSGGQNLNFAVPINYVRGILDSLALSPNNAPPLISGRTATAKSETTRLTPKAETVPPNVPTPIDPHLLIPAPSAPAPATSTIAKAEPSSPRTAVIWFFRTKSMTDSMLNPTIFANGIPLAKIEKGQYFGIIVQPGTHYFSWTDRPKPKEQAYVTVRSGEQFFFSTRYRMIAPADAATWNKELLNLRPIEGKNILHSSVLRVNDPRQFVTPH